MQREVEVLKRHRSEMDDKMLTTMMSVEEAAQVVQRCQSARRRSDAPLAGRQRRPERGTQSTCWTASAAIEERREAICVAIPRADLTVYSTLRGKKPNGVAVHTGQKTGHAGSAAKSASSVLLQQTRTGTSPDPPAPRAGRIPLHRLTHVLDALLSGPIYGTSRAKRACFLVAV